MSYRGRFAPSPTGPLHFGSLIAAVASFLQARARGGEWLVRIDDVDVPHVVAGAADEILRVLDALGLHWDGPVIHQSARLERYRAALADLSRRGRIYPCGCSRRETGPGVYPGTCRDGLPPGKSPRSLRLRTAESCVQFEDAVQGHCSQALGREVGDFVVDRADGVVAYHLATAVDDAEQGMTEIVRGVDLLGSTPRQIFLMRELELPQPRYAHVPVAVNAAGQKLSKQTYARPLDPAGGAAHLVGALAFLGQGPPAGLGEAPIDAVWQWAIENWRLSRVPPVREIVYCQIDNN